MTAVELVGGPLDGKLIDVKPDELFGRLEFEVPDIGKRLAAGERVPADEAERPQVIVHTYSRTERLHDGALQYRFVRPGR